MSVVIRACLYLLLCVCKIQAGRLYTLLLSLPSVWTKHFRKSNSEPCRWSGCWWTDVLHTVHKHMTRLYPVKYKHMANLAVKLSGFQSPRRCLNWLSWSGSRTRRDNILCLMRLQHMRDYQLSSDFCGPLSLDLWNDESCGTPMTIVMMVLRWLSSIDEPNGTIDQCVEKRTM